MTRRLALFWAPLVAYLGLVFWLSSLSQAEVALPDFQFSDKVAHVVEYALAGALFARAFAYGGPALAGRRIVFAASLAGALYGVSDELHQGWFPERNRHAGVDDAIADAIGSVLGAGLWVRLRHRREVA